jgi:hypothetical protein
MCIQIQKWEPDPDPERRNKGYVVPGGRMTVKQVADALRTALEAEGLTACEYGPDIVPTLVGWVGDCRPWPSGRIVAYVVQGGSEGYYVYVSVIGRTQTPQTHENIILSKLYDCDKAWKIARRTYELLTTDSTTI